MRSTSLGKPILFCLLVLSLCLNGCETHNSQPMLTQLPGMNMGAQNNAPAGPSTQDIADAVMYRVNEKLQVLAAKGENKDQRTLAEKGQDIAFYLETVRELFPQMTDEEAQRYALNLMAHYGLPTPKIASLGVKATQGSSGASTNNQGSQTQPKPQTEPKKETSEYPVFPNEDEGADPSVSAEDGGKGFAAVAEKMGFKTNMDFPLVGDPKALKGGSFSYQISDYPETLRPFGKRSNTWFNYLARDIMYDRLLYYHHTTLEWCPMLATHWKIEQNEEKQVFWYRINPNARWADGTPITSDDVIETWRLLVDPDLDAPSTNTTYEKYYEPVAISKYIVKVECKKLNWRNFNYFSGFHILQAKQLREQPVKEWLKEYNFRYMTPSGPYTAIQKELDEKKGSEVILTRRKDYWAADHRRVAGCFNFDKLRYIVIRESRAAFESVKAGDYDCFLMTTAKWWVEDTETDRFKKGLLLKRRFYSSSPNGIMGLAFNMGRYPLNDRRVRKALALLIDREELLEKLMYNQYEPQTSYWSYGDYENKNNPKNKYDPDAALKLLAEAGWDERNAQGRLVKDGVPLELELLYSTPGLKRHYSLIQNTYQKAGINLNLRLVAPQTGWKRVQEKDYQIASQAWGALHIPNPESSWKSEFADQPNTNNIVAFKNERVDELIEEYDKLELTTEERSQIIREMDGIIANEYPYALLWYGPFKRFIFWNKFGYPKGGMVRTIDDADTISWLWWYDPEKAQMLKKAQQDPSVQLDRGKTDDRYWVDVWPQENKK